MSSTWHDFSQPTKKPVCDSVTPRSLPQHDSSTPGKDSVCESVTPRCMPHSDLDEEAGFGDIAGSGIESYRLSHDESFRVDDLDLNLNEPEPIVEEVRTQEPIVEEVRTQEPIVEEVIVEDYVSSWEDVEHDDDDDDFLVDEEIEIVEPHVDVHVFGISMDVPFDNIGVTNLKFTTAKEVNDRVYLHSIESRRNLKMYKNDSVRVRARCDGKVHVFIMSQGTGPTGPNQGMEVGPSGSSGPTTRRIPRKNTSTNDDSQACYFALDAHDKGDL
nr:shikimate O-hydroxycinnamoyltransferase [Tanacetum cinerariifolium]